MSDFVHLHVHTEYSLLDGACRLEPLVLRAKELGQEAVAITDHGAMYGVIDFYKLCKKHGVRPIIGCEVYVAPRTRFDKQHGMDSSPYHLVLLCKDNGGYQNLIKLVSLGYIDGFYNKPRVDREILERYSQGLICLSACLAGEIPRTLTAGEYQKAKEAALWHQKVFGEGNYYIELQDHGIREQRMILPMLQKLSEETGIPMAATNDSHYLQKEDSKMQNVMVCIQTNRVVGEEGNLEFATDEFYVKSGEEMERLFGAYPGALSNTVDIARRCQVEFTFGETKLPRFVAPGGKDNDEYFRQMCREGLLARYGEHPPKEVEERLQFEVDVIRQMGYVDYFLIVHDFIDYAKKQGIPVGPGRGSGAGSVAAYCMGITGIDPIKYNLLFERFLNPERVSMPDFDIDFCYERRQEVIDYVVDKYGSDHVAQIITFGTMAARGAIRDVGRALGVSYQAVDVIAKLIPFELGMTIGRALEASKEFRAVYDADPRNKELIDMARKLEGMARHASTHAAGVVITREPADHYVPLQKNDESIVTQFTMTTLEELGLLKMDFLGLRTLTVISDAGTMIRRTAPGFDVDAIPLDDAAVFQMLSKGQTGGVFQFESAGMKNVLASLGPEHMEDLIAVISLYRPGPMDSIPRYVQNRHNPGMVTYKHPLLEPILRVTYGCIVYQEQVMQICRELAGYSYGRADLVRRAMSKKKQDVMQRERQVFLYGTGGGEGDQPCPGAVANGVAENVANSIFDEMSSFASYAFNKSHAAAYALVAYQTAYLKHYYPKEYMAALLTSVLDNTDKVIDYIGEAKRMGIDVLPPSVNESSLGFQVVGDKIRFGLLAVKNLGRGFLREMVSQREREGPFGDLLDFLERMYGHDLNRRAIESLIKCGALDHFGHTRKQMMDGFERMWENVEKSHRNNISGQMDLFGGGQETAAEYILPDTGEYPVLQKLTFEKETTGLYLSGHPLSQHEEEIRKVQATGISSLHRSEKLDGKKVCIVGIVSNKKLKTTKNNDMMAFVEVEDKTGSIELIVFPRVYESGARFINTGEILVISGRVKAGEEEDAQLVCDDLQPLAEYRSGGNSGAKPASSRKRGLYLKFPEAGSQLVEPCRRVLDVFEGVTPVYFYYNDTGKYVRTPKSYWIMENDVMTRELRRILGGDNVVFID